MEVFQLDGMAERAAMTAMCLDTEALAMVAPTWEDDSFPSRWSNIVARWAVNYYREYKKAPGIEGITALYTDWADTADKDTATIVYKWLSTLEPTTGVASGYAATQIQKLITKTSTKRLADKMLGALSNGKVEEAAALAETWKRPKSATALDYISLFEHQEIIEAELATVASDPLITYKGDLGQFINPLLVRSSLVAFLAPTKRGKSTVLMDMAWQAAKQKRKVAYFSTGDLSRPQILDRLRTKALRRPKFPCTYRIPKSLDFDGKEPIIEGIVKQETTGLLGADGADVFQKLAKDDRFRLVAKSANTTTAGDIADTLKRWADDGWVADVVVIDYADILRGMGYSKETRDQINENWITMSALRIELDCLVITATQADTEGMDAWLLNLRNFNGDRRKWDHCTAVLGLNMTQSERKAGVFRLNHLALREGDFASEYPHSVAVAGCAKVGAPIIVSKWVR